jgi:cell division protein FtsW
MGKKTAMDPGYDLLILIPTLLLVSLGLVFVFSASSPLGSEYRSDGLYYLKRQSFFALLGILALITGKNIPPKLYGKLVYFFMAASLAMLMMLFVPGLGVKVKGACRWLNLGLFSFQPSEVAKVTLAVYMAYSMSKKGELMSTFSKGVFPHLVIAGGFMGLILLQPDLGTAVIIGCWVMTLLYIGGARIWHLAGLVLMGVPFLIWGIYRASYRIDRLTAFWDPWKHPEGIGFQIIHSFLAFGSGGLFGAGFGGSKQKLFYLPEPHTDFVFAVAAEEAGFAGVTLIVVLFAVLLARGFKAGLDSRDVFSSYLALGLVTMLGLQVLINMGVVTSLLPTKGLTLPLMSYGGSSLVINLFIIGILLRISSERKAK